MHNLLPDLWGLTSLLLEATWRRWRTPPMCSTHISSSQGSTRRGLHAAEAAELSPRASPPSPMSVTCYQCEQCDHSPSLPTHPLSLSFPLSPSVCMCFYSEEHMPSSLHLPCCTGLSPGITTLHLKLRQDAQTFCGRMLQDGFI